MLDAGDPAPDFYLPAADDPGAEYMLSAAADAGPVVLAFVPDNPSVGRPLLESLASVDWARLVDRVSVFGIGSDPDAMTELAEGLPFPVVQDRGGYVADLYGVGSTDGARRALVVADSECVIRFAWESGGDEQAPLDELQSAVAGSTDA
ncbi:redoxin domain-containing protein [Halapricum desulfuricans]|uniref:Peroxiredoxin n=1 Tax=Halapricum desulfuricans TaxID=2841257 RepID=A0A897NR05_9EURY|nr:redoxin domain-containing protein [Halapricum desulfuricans]QSG15237.1 Peroxiredoxin [Halapricum desulfuricans]